MPNLEIQKNILVPFLTNENAMEILLYLIIGHLIGDFLLQSSSLVAYKQRSIYGLLLHILMIMISHTTLLIPYLKSDKIAFGLVFIFVLHFIIDYTKIELNMQTKYPIIPFALDQLAHFITIFLAYFIIRNETPLFFIEQWWFEIIYQNIPLLLYFAGVIFFSYTMDIVYLTFKLQKDPSYKYKRGYFDMLVRVSVFALIYLIYSAYFTN